jgi:hypothetical protein
VAVPQGRETSPAFAPNRLVWIKSSASSSGTATECIEVATTESHVALRDSKDPEPMIVVSSQSWQAFLFSTLPARR